MPELELDLASPVRLGLADRDNSGLRIVHITEAPLGGVLSYLQELIAGHAQSQYVQSIHALVPEINAVPLSTTSPPSVEVRSFRHSRGSLTSLVRLAFESRRIVRDIRPHIVHIHSTIAGLVVRVALLSLPHNAKVLYSPHGWAFARSRRFTNAFAGLVERLMSPLIDSIVCVSEFEKRQATKIGIPETKCTVILSGVKDIADGHPRTPQCSCSGTGRLNILFVGRFDNEKGFDVYLKVMRQLKDIADGTAVGGFIVDRARPLDIPENVQVVGWRSRDELLALYEGADILLMPSRSESFGLVALEAMRASLPVIASRVGGLPEVIDDNVTGWLVEPEDVEGIIKIIRSTPHTRLGRFGVNGRARFHKYFNAKIMSSRILSHYTEIVSLPLHSARLSPAE